MPKKNPQTALMRVMSVVVVRVVSNEDFCFSPHMSCPQALGVASPVRQQPDKLRHFFPSALFCFSRGRALSHSSSQPLGAKEQMAFSIQALSEAAYFDEEKLERAI